MFQLFSSISQGMFLVDRTGRIVDPWGHHWTLATHVEDVAPGEMERRIDAVIARIDAAGGMYAAAEKGIVQRMIGDSARAFQEQVEQGTQTVVGVNAYRVEEDPEQYRSLEYPHRERMAAQLQRLAQFKKGRAQRPVEHALGELARAAQGGGNVFAQVIEAVEAGATHGEVCGRLRRELGFGQPLTVV